jgi:thiamine-phosphate pyrophosphorylase
MVRQGKVFTVIDANFNRCREGLRVVEDYFRFINKNNDFQQAARRIRHQLKDVFDDKLKCDLICSRDVKSDSGKTLDELESNRGNFFDILYANLQRVKESLRVLEEVSKLIDKKYTARLKKIRYEVYIFEKKIIAGKLHLSNTRSCKHQGAK